MNYPQLFEGLYQEELHIFQSFRLLSIFPIRNNPIQLTLSAYQKIYKQLTCTLCEELMDLPVYLKCGHRFCKKCIQMHIRSTSNKTCPYCRNDQILSKDDIKIDDFSIDFATILFEDVSVIKGEATSKMIKNQQQNTLQNSSIQAKFQQSIQQLSTSQIELNINKKRGRPKKTPFLWNQSLQPNQEPIKTEQEYQQPMVRKKTIIALSDNTSQEKIIQNKLIIIDKQSQQNLIKKEQQLTITPPNQQLIITYQQQVKSLQKEYSKKYGSNYFNRLAQITVKDIYIQIKLIPVPNKPFTPPLNCQFILCSPHCTAICIFRFIGLELNISKNNVRLSIRTKHNMKQIYEFDKISKINERYWMNRDFNAISLSEMLDQITLQDQREDKKGDQQVKNRERIIYFEITYQKTSKHNYALKKNK